MNLIEWSGNEPTGCHQSAQHGTSTVEQMKRFVVVSDVESC